MKTLEEYLQENHDKNIIDHVIRANVDADGGVSFYIHALGFDSDTLDFAVANNRLTALQVEQPDGSYMIKKQAQYVKCIDYEGTTLDANHVYQVEDESNTHYFITDSSGNYIGWWKHRFEIVS